MTIYINTPGVYELTADVYDNIIIGVAGVTLNGNNFTVHGDGTGGPLINTIGILSSSQNTIVQNVNVEGFAAGVHLGGAGSKVSYVDVYECLIRGIGVAGGNEIIEHSTAGYLGGAPDWFFGATAGMAVWGDDNVIRNSNVHHLNGPFESVGFVFGGRGSLVDSLCGGHRRRRLVVWGLGRRWRHWRRHHHRDLHPLVGLRDRQRRTGSGRKLDFARLSKRRSLHRSRQRERKRRYAQQQRLYCRHDWPRSHHRRSGQQHHRRTWWARHTVRRSWRRHLRVQPQRGVVGSPGFHIGPGQDQHGLLRPS